MGFWSALLISVVLPGLTGHSCFFAESLHDSVHVFCLTEVNHPDRCYEPDPEEPPRVPVVGQPVTPDVLLWPNRGPTFVPRTPPGLGVRSMETGISQPVTPDAGDFVPPRNTPWSRAAV